MAWNVEPRQLSQTVENAAITAAETMPVASMREHLSAGRWRCEASDIVGNRAVFHGMSEVAVALHLSGAPLSRELSTSQILAAVMLGVQRVGMARVREWDEQARRLNLRWCHASTTTAAERREYAAMWTHERQTLCIDLAERSRPRPRSW